MGHTVQVLEEVKFFWLEECSDLCVSLSSESTIRQKCFSLAPWGWKNRDYLPNVFLEQHSPTDRFFSFESLFRFTQANIPTSSIEKSILLVAHAKRRGRAADRGAAKRKFLYSFPRQESPSLFENNTDIEYTHLINVAPKRAPNDPSHLISLTLYFSLPHWYAISWNANVCVLSGIRLFRTPLTAAH